MNAITKTDAKPMLLDFMADRAGLRPDEFSATVRKTCGMVNASAEEFAAFLMPPKPPAPPSVAVTSARDGARASAGQRAEDDIIDAEVVDPDTGEVTDEQSADDAVVDEATDKAIDFLTKLDTALANCTSTEDIVEVWNEMDPLATLEGNDDAQAAAKSYKRKHTQRISK